MEIEEEHRLNSPEICEEEILATRMSGVQLPNTKQTTYFK
jgi:hypothetical protein